MQVPIKKIYDENNHLIKMIYPNNIDESIRRNFKNWHVEGTRIANASEISLLDKNELSPFEAYKLKLMMQQSSSNHYSYGCK